MFVLKKFMSHGMANKPFAPLIQKPRGPSFFSSRFNFSSQIESFKKLRNIGISAHIDSGKTTFTERVLFYAGRIGQIHEVRGSDNVGAKMDFMELEREKGITIQSAATHLTWGEHKINIIDTPGHVDFTIEVERALRVLDGAVLIVCGASGVQPQTLTVDKQMKRYSIPRIIFINKLDRMGANPWTAIDGIRKRLNLVANALQIPIGSDQTLKGLVDLVKMKAFYFEGPQGDKIVESDIPDSLKEEAIAKRQELIESLANLDSEIEDLFLNEKEISEAVLKAAIRRQTIALKFCPVLMGSAYKNKGVQLALNAVCDYLPAPDEIENHGFKLNEKKPDEPEEKIVLVNDAKKPFCGYAFKLEENKFGQLTFVRVYQGRLKKGDYVYNMKVKKRMKVSRMVKMHANEMEDINEVEAGDIFAIFGLECATGDSLTEGDMSYQVNCSSLYVPAPVMSLSIKPLKNEYNTKFQKALNKFRREDPTFHVNVDKESEEIIISGMGELHLQIYAERIKREFGIECEVGNPSVNYRETIASSQSFDYLHKKQSGGAGQYARVIGYIEPMPYTESGEFQTSFQNKVVGTSIPNEFITAVEKGFYDTIEKGPLTGYPIVNVKYILEDGVTHPVDSSSNAFMIASRYSFLEAFHKADPQILEPIMNVEITISQSSYSDAMASISKRRGLITNTETRGDMFILNAEVPLSCMFGYATELRGMSAGTAEFAMEYKNHAPLPVNEASQVIARYKKKLRNKE